MRNVLVAVHLDSFFTNLFPVACALRDLGACRPVMHFPVPYGRWREDARRCREAGLAVACGSDERALSVAPPPARPTGAKALAKEFLRPSWRLVRDSFPFQAVWLLRRMVAIRRLIRRERIGVLLLGADVVHYDTAAYVRAAHLEGVPALVAAGWMIHQDENAEAFRFDPALQAGRLGNRLAAWAFPRWLYRYKGSGLVRLPSGHIWARELLGIAPPLPWVLHSGHADRILVESEAALEACRREGLPAGQVALVGGILHDAMRRVLDDPAARRRDLCARLGLADPDRPLLLWAMPPDEFYRPGGRPECVFPDHHQVVGHFLRLAGSLACWNVVFSLHPSIGGGVRERMAAAGAAVWDGHTADAVPLCDLFVASGSTTVQWAALCGRPIIDYDVYRYRQDDYRGMAGRLATEDLGEFEAILRRLAADDGERARLAAASAAGASRWGVLDGQAGRRIAERIEQEAGRWEGRR